MLCNLCLDCAARPNLADSHYAECLSEHKDKFQKNTGVGSGQMKVVAAKVMFERSLQKRELCYTRILWDEDSQTYTALKNDKVYGFIPTNMQECFNRVTKRMGTALRNLVQRNKSKGL